MSSTNNHYIAIIGGSVAGSEAAHQLADKGFKIAVFDQMQLPYGKIEDGLPKWHVKLRDKEEDAIDTKLQHESIRFIPNCRLGEDIGFASLVDEWKFSAIILAIGAWRDRELALPGIEKFVNNGLIYQNQLIKWFNHYHESDYNGPQFEIPDGTAVIGGGLSSIDVIKIVQIIIVQDALAKRGIDEDVFTMERGIDRILEKHQLTMEELSLKGATLFYRKSARDMPLKPYSDESQKEKAQEVSEKMLNITMKRFLFNFEPNSVAKEAIIEDDKLEGVVFQRSKLEDRKLTPIVGSEYKFKTSLVISSIGSLPEKLIGIPSKGDLLKTTATDECRIKGFDNVFAIGNAVTGRGNIKESRIHGRESTERIIDTRLDPKKEQFNTYLRTLENQVDKQVNQISESLEKIEPLSEKDIKNINSKITQLQESVGYDEDYLSWKEKHLWERLEH